MSKYYIVYKTINLVNNKIYIGIHETNNLNDGYLGSGKRIKRSIRYYGKENFKREILMFGKNRQEIIDKEIELVTEDFVSRKDTYNLNIGGELLFSKELQSKGGKKGNKIHQQKYKTDPEYRKKFSEANKRRWKDEDYRTFMLEKMNWSGKNHSEESKSKIGKSNSIKQKGSKNSQFGTCWITNEKENKKIPKGNAIPYSWRLGRKINKK